VSSANSPGASPSRGPLVIVLAVIGILAIIAGILYVSGAANSIHFMDGAVHHGHHLVRAIVSFVVGIAFLIGAYIAKSRPATSSAGSAGSTGSAGGSPSDSATTSGT
jgi:hypothetical protein